MITSLHTLRLAAATAIVAVGSLLPALLPTAEAKDLSLPYRNSPGFTCHHWNAAGECTDFSYFDQAPAGYYPSPAPTHSSSASYTACLRTYAVSYCNALYGRGSSSSTTSAYTACLRTYSASYCQLHYGSSTTSTAYSSCLRNYSRSYCDSRYGRETRNTDDDITVRVTASPNPVEEDELLTYSIYIRNDDNDDQDVDLRAFLDPDTEFEHASDSGREYRGDEVRWDNLEIRRRSSRTVNLTVRVDDSARDGDELRLRVEADDAEDDVITEVGDEDDDGDLDSDYEDCLDDHSRSYCDDRFEDEYDDCREDHSRSYCDERFGRDDDDDDNDDDYEDCLDDGYSRSYCDSRYGDDDDDDDEDISIRVNASEDEPDEGELVTFTILLRNDDSRVRTVDVTGFLDNDLDFYSASDGGNEHNREVEWENIAINARGTRTITVSARVDDDARSGDELTFSAETEDDEDEVTVEVR